MKPINTRESYEGIYCSNTDFDLNTANPGPGRMIFRDFQIEGMSIGDSLLDYFSKNEMKKFLKADTTHFYNNSDYVIIGIYKENQNSISLNNYESLGITINKKDNKYKILSIAGQNYSYDDINDCNTTQASIANDIKKMY